MCKVRGDVWPAPFLLKRTVNIIFDASISSPYCHIEM